MKIPVPFLALLLSTVGLAQAVDESHIEANVPPPLVFAGFLQRDVGAFLTNRLGQKTTVEYHLLRDQPTQSGVAYPKFYIWIRGLGEQENVVVEGAMRLAAIDKNRFEVTDFVTKEQIVANPNQIETTFPQALISKIRERAGIK